MLNTNLIAIVLLSSTRTSEESFECFAAKVPFHECRNFLGVFSAFWSLELGNSSQLRESHGTRQPREITVNSRASSVFLQVLNLILEEIVILPKEETFSGNRA